MWCSDEWALLRKLPVICVLQEIQQITSIGVICTSCIDILLLKCTNKSNCDASLLWFQTFGIEIRGSGIRGSGIRGSGIRGSGIRGAGIRGGRNQRVRNQRGQDERRLELDGVGIRGDRNQRGQELEGAGIRGGSNQRGQCKTAKSA